jgi:hypothetical protein
MVPGCCAARRAVRGGGPTGGRPTELGDGRGEQPEAEEEHEVPDDAQDPRAHRVGVLGRLPSRGLGRDARSRSGVLSDIGQCFRGGKGVPWRFISERTSADQTDPQRRRAVTRPPGTPQHRAGAMNARVSCAFPRILRGRFRYIGVATIRRAAYSSCTRSHALLLGVGRDEPRRSSHLKHFLGGDGPLRQHADVVAGLPQNQSTLHHRSERTRGPFRVQSTPHAHACLKTSQSNQP